MNPLYTLGHATLSIAQFLALLQQWQIPTVVDVRSHPYSRYTPHFTSKTLKSLLFHHQLTYHYLGQSLGGKLENTSYPYRMREPVFQQGITQLIGHIHQTPVVILCAEWDPIRCHRMLLISRYLSQTEPALPIFHILSMTHAESHQQAEQRLLVTPSQMALF